MKIPRVFLVVLTGLTACTTLAAQVPQLINYQGRVVVGTTNFNGTGQFKFALVDGAGTTTYWSNDGTGTGGGEPTAAVALAVNNGLYSVLLGDATRPNMTVVPATVFTHGDVRLRVWFNDGTNGSQLLAPDQRIAAVGYALMAGNVADGAITAAKIAPGAVTGDALATGAITADKLAAGQAVKGINGLSDQVTFAAGANVAITANGNELTISAIGGGGGGGWALGGNAVGAGTSFLGTTDNQPLDFKANGLRGLRIYDPGDSDDSGDEPDGAPNLIGGAPGNTVSAGVVGATIAGGGATNFYGTAFSNSIAGNFGFIGGGYSNAIQADSPFAQITGGRFNTIQTGAGESSIGGGLRNTVQAGAFRAIVGGGEDNTIQTGAIYSIIAGGYANSISGGYAFVAGGEANAAGPASFAAGHRAKATHSGSFVWADATDENFATTANNQLLIRASGGVGIGTNAPGAALEVAGQVKITGGSPGAGKILMSDANGLASWQSMNEITLGQNYTSVLPDVLDNSVDAEIAGWMNTQASYSLDGKKIVVISGVGFETQRVVQFAGSEHDDTAGPNAEMPFIFEYEGNNADELQAFYERGLEQPTDTRTVTIRIPKIDGSPAFTWILRDMLLTKIEPGGNGRKRYTLTHQRPPNLELHYDWDYFVTFPTVISINPATDLYEVAIAGITSGEIYPLVEIDPATRTLTMTFDYNEDFDEVLNWSKLIAENIVDKRGITLIKRTNGVETQRQVFLGCFPIKFQQTTGFAAFEKMKAKIVISYDVRQEPLISANAADNSADLEVEGFLSTQFPAGSPKIVVVSGPGVEIERIPGFLTTPNDQAGVNTEMPFVFEYAGPQDSNFQQYYNHGINYPDDLRAVSIIMKRGDGSAAGRWNLFDMRLTKIEQGTNGRMRYTMSHQKAPDNLLGYERDSNQFENRVSINPATDSYFVEIEGVDQGGYPAVEVDYVNRTMTMTFDAIESGDAFGWVKGFIQGYVGKRAMSLVTKVNNVETARRNFYGIFPIRYQQTTGWSQLEKMKEQVVISFDYWEEAN